ncbi:MAG: ferrous iron transport protein B [Candidatus Kapaibacterium sp.]|nr:MAG: ferrous iron transport protein B [Candidatus Kapabacteria bacterium]
MGAVPQRNIALVGIPNSGKTTLFNALTGARKKVANYPGVTVEPTVGLLANHAEAIALVDLPGVYSLSPKSSDEEITSAALKGELRTIPPLDGIVLILDATNLEKGLFLFSQLVTLQKPMLVALTMIDEVKRRGATLDDILLESRLGVPVVPIVGTKGIGITELKAKLVDRQRWRIPPIHLPLNASVEERIAWARQIASEVLRNDRLDERTERLDRILLHPVWGMVAFVIVMALIFQSIFTWSQPLMDAIDSGFSTLRQWIVGDAVAPPLVLDFLANGVIAGVGSVLVFAPQIFVLMVLVTFLEDTGYMARAAFLVDRIFGIFGLQGRSFIPLLSSYACAIPGILSARMIPSYAERMATMLVAPLMTCSARLPVYTLLIAAFVPAGTVGGFLSLQALVLGMLYVAAAVVGLVIAWLLRKTVLADDRTAFFIEFPPYRLPQWRNLLVRATMRMQDFVQTAGTIILAISIVLWALATFPRLEPRPGMSADEYRRAQLEQSWAAHVGRTVAPIFRPMHFDWQVTLGIIGSFAAREVFVSVMGQLYAVGQDDPASASLRAALQQQLSPPVAFAVLAFYMFALQCMSTVAVLRRETGSWKWTAFAFVYMFLLAYLAAAGTYNIARALLS